MLIFLIGFLFAVTLALAASRLNDLWQHRLLIFLALLFPCSEIWKQLTLTTWTGGIYIWWHFPFQLCSMPLYLLPLRQVLLKLRHLTAVNILTDFLIDFSLLGGLCAFIDQSGMHYDLFVLTVHSYLWHFTMIFLGLFLVLSPKLSRRSTDSSQVPVRRSYLPVALLFLFLATIAQCFNALFHTNGSINMFYISFWEPVTQIVFSDIAQLIGIPLEALIYLGCLLLGGLIVHKITELPVFIPKPLP